MNTFQEMDLHPSLLKALQELGYIEPTEIQKKAIPTILENNPDFIGLAQTGTGKTASFGLPLLTLIDEKNSAIQGLIIAPTRELAQQIEKELVGFARYLKGVDIVSVYGGAAITNQIKDIKRKKPAIIVATPGRLIDLIGRKVIKIDQVKYVVLDEADEMLNMGFQEDIDKILEYTSDDKKTWLFSATMPREIRQIVHKYMDSPMEVSIDRDQKTNKNIRHIYLIVRREDKFDALHRVADYLPNIYALVFCRTKIETQQIADKLGQAGISADAIHGDLSQKQRDHVMNKFKTKKLQILVATDVAARGIDVNDLTHVIHFNLPDNNEYYTHRSGRTARAGKKGISLSIVQPNEVRKIKSLERQLKIEVERVLVPNYSELVEKKITNWEEKVNNIELDEIRPEIKARAEELFSELTKEEVIAKLLSLQWKKLVRKRQKEDLNVEESMRSERSSRGDRDRGRGRGRDRDRGRSRDRDRGRSRDGDRDRGRSRDGERDRDGDRDRGRSREGERDRDGDRDRRDRDRGRDRDRDREGGTRRDRARNDGERSDRSSRDSRNEDRERKGRDKGGKAVYLNLGSVDKYSKGNILNFICERGKCTSDSIGRIEISKRFSLVYIDDKLADTVVNNIQGKSIKGKKIIAKLD